ncbi:MAG TPA: molybdopterin-dependent oxidoreductase [Candidatus Binatus sp.]|nr:molybdopterin-dependent oxidoreductase [Candidatus Binatus sp.]
MIETHRSFCRFCHAVCGIEVDIEDGRVLDVRGDKHHPVSHGYLCVKGKELAAQHAHPERLRGAKKRTTDGTFEDLPSEQALDEIAARLRDIIARDGPGAVAVYSGTHGLFSAAKPTIIAWITALGSPWYFTPNTIDQPSQQTAWARHGTWDAGVHRFADADVMLFVGNNPGVSAFSRDGGPPYANAFKHLRDARRRGLRIIAIDPRRTELARGADVHLQVKPGEDPTLLAGMVRVILGEGLYDRDFVAAHVTGVEALRDAVADYTPAYVEERTTVPAALMERAARLFAAGRCGTAMTCTGVNMAPRPDVTQHFVVALNSLCGRFNRAGDPVRNPGVLRPPRAWYADVEPPRPLWGDGPRSRFRGLGRFGEEMPINVFADEVLTPGAGQLKALVCVGGNPAVAFPDQRKVLAALAALELSVVLDVKMTATAKLAGYVFGCKLSFEKPGTSRTAEAQLDVPFAQYTPALVDPDCDVIEEWEFFWGLAHRMRTPLQLANGAVLDLDRKPTPDQYLDLTHRDSRVPLEEVRRHPGGSLFPPVAPVSVQPARPGKLAARMDVAPAAVIAQIRDIRSEPFSATGGYRGDVRFTHRLISRRMLEVYNSTGDHLPGLRRRYPYNPAFLHPDDLERIGVRPGDVVRIDSDHDFIYGVAEASVDVRPGVVSMAHAHGDAPEHDGEVRTIGSTTGRLVSTDRDFEPISGIPRQSAIPVNVRPLTPSELAAIAPGR